MVIAVFPALSLNAQPQGEGKPEFKGKHRPMPTVDEIAQQRADVMNQELTLSEKQYKKILKYFKAQVEKEREIMQAGRPDGVPKGFPGGKSLISVEADLRWEVPVIRVAGSEVHREDFQVETPGWKVAAHRCETQKWAYRMKRWKSITNSKTRSSKRFSLQNNMKNGG